MLKDKLTQIATHVQPLSTLFQSAPAWSGRLVECGGLGGVVGPDLFHGDEAAAVPRAEHLLAVCHEAEHGVRGDLGRVIHVSDGRQKVDEPAACVQRVWGESGGGEHKFFWKRRDILAQLRDLLRNNAPA